MLLLQRSECVALIFIRANAALPCEFSLPTLRTRVAYFGVETFNSLSEVLNGTYGWSAFFCTGRDFGSW